MSVFPIIRPETGLFRSVEGVFYRTIDPTYRNDVISGSRLPGRYSTCDQPTLYLSSSPDAMNASIRVHAENRSSKQEVMLIEVLGDGIFDLREEKHRNVAGIDINDAISPWQQVVKDGGNPSSWAVRDRIVQLGGKGLIDPSRQIPGLWHLVLFQWNQERAPQVRVVNKAH